MAPVTLLWVAAAGLRDPGRRPHLRRHRQPTASGPGPRRSPSRASQPRGSTAAWPGATQQRRSSPSCAVIAVLFAGLAGRVRAQPVPHPRPPRHPAPMLAGNLLPPQILLDPGRHDLRAASASTTPCSALVVVQVGFGHRLLHLRAARLHALPAARDLRGREDRRRRDLRIFGTHRAAAVPAGAGRARGAGDHLDLQRPDLGDDGAAHRVEVPDHRGAAQPAGRLHQRLERRRRRIPDRGRPDRDRVLRVPEAVRVRAAGGRNK